MRVRFLLGRSGVGKTWQCLDEARGRLLGAPEGPPLIFLAPKQATFQIERQLLADGSLGGFTRLGIYSLERFARWVLASLGVHRSFIDEQGRVMLLRALLGRAAKSLKLFHASAHYQGFAQELAELISELKRHGVTPDQLESLSRNARDPRQSAKLSDIAFLVRAYGAALDERGVHDTEDLPGLATAALRASRGPLAIEALWLDSFAELSPVEADLLAALKGRCEAMTLAFNIGGDQREGWLSPWAQSHSTVSLLRRKFAEAECECVIEKLPVNVDKGRFAQAPLLAHLERAWETSEPAQASAQDQVRIVSCPTREAEAVVAAREILRFVREKNGRFRETAILARDLEGFHEVLARTLRRYEIPAFIDRREPVSHHPLAELTRSALRVVLHEWEHDDWFSALKTGLVHPDAAALDALENTALAEGCQGAVWLKPLQGEEMAPFEALRKQLIRPFRQLRKELGQSPSGATLADALNSFWRALEVESKLESWSQERNEQVHRTFWGQMQAWLEDLRGAFGDEPLPMASWLPIVESGLASQTVGLIPPALDQVLIGAVDRSRNPDLRLVIVVGMNEGVFPAAPASGGLLSEWDRRWLSEQGLALGASLHAAITRERFYGYIACTRPRERLVITSSARDGAGAETKPSRFIARVQQITGAQIEEETEEALLQESVGRWEAFHALLANGAAAESLESGGDILRPLAAKLEAWRKIEQPPSLHPLVAGELYGQQLIASVSSMEDFGACPFSFFIKTGLKARERQLVKLDAREQGSFRHLVLRAFHEKIRAQDRRWTDLAPEEAAELIGQLGQELAERYGHGVLRQTPQARFEAAAITRSLQAFIKVIIGWMRTSYAFSPAHAELSFGPAQPFQWVIQLENGRTLSLRGQIDRVDLAEEGEALYAVAVDYKSTGEIVSETLAEAGIQIQLLAYLAALTESPNARDLFGKPLLPAGFFYVPLKTRLEGAKSRGEAKAEAAAKLKANLRHSGRFDSTLLRLLARDPGAGHIRCGDRANDGLDPIEFRSLVGKTRLTLAAFAERAYSGDIAISPFKHRSRTACKDCRLGAVCRFDDWTDSYRKLTP